MKAAGPMRGMLASVFTLRKSQTPNTAFPIGKPRGTPLNQNPRLSGLLFVRCGTDTQTGEPQTCRRRMTRSSEMQVRDIMTRNVITVSPDTSVLDVASLLVHHHISGVPVAAGDS